MKKLKNTPWVVCACLLFCYAIFGSTALAMEYNIAHITKGADGWQDYLIVDNMGDATETFDVVLYNAGTQVITQPYAIASMASRTIDLKQLESQADCGCVVVPNTTTLLNGITFLRFRLLYKSDADGICEFELSPMNKSQLVFNFSNDFPSIIEWKGLAVMNTDTTTSAPISLYAIYGNGNLSLPVTSTVPANGKLVGFHSDWFPSIAVDDIKSIIISSVSSSLCGICISGDYANSKLLFTQAGDGTLFREIDITTRYMVDSKLLEGNWVFNVTYPATDILEYSYYINKLTGATNIEGGYVIGGLNMYVPTPPLVARENIIAQRWPSTGNFTLTDTTNEEIPGSTVRRVYTFTLDNPFTETDYYSVTGTVVETVIAGPAVPKGAGTFTGRQVSRIINNNPDVDQ
ncbi:MAG: hypothetical protein KAU60_05275 [Desulfobacterales bacterium]|nr:hypothetical protein [Desulfobacterales bacterium]